MATYNVSNASQLKSAIGHARGGDVIRLAAGNYGQLDLTNKKFSGNVTITSASDSNQAKFTSVIGTNVANFTLDNLTFANSGWGVRLGNASNVTVSDSTFTDLANGLKFYTSNNINVKNNYFTRLDIDAMQFAGLTNSIIQNNKYVESGSKSGWTHKDFIQFYTVKTYGNPSKNVKIAGNELHAKDGQTHGILILNEANMSMHQNIAIQNNFFKMSSKIGIWVTDTNGILVQGNSLIKDGANLPTIKVTDCLSTQIASNTATSAGSVSSSSGSTTATSGADTIKGTSGADTLVGAGGNDTLIGAGGGDTLRGQAGNDFLRGDGGRDNLIGGLGSDRFDFNAVSDSPGGAPDIIKAGDSAIAFQRGVDRIDLGGIDANTTVDGNQAFKFGGSGKGYLSVVEQNGDTLVRGNVDGDSTFELAILIKDGTVKASAYTAADFIL
jgi:Ca2+-binding RTX toxin-like protein